MAAVTDEAGFLLERLAYDPWGKRRWVDGVADVTDSLVGRATDRGFTAQGDAGSGMQGQVSQIAKRAVFCL